MYTLETPLAVARVAFLCLIFVIHLISLVLVSIGMIAGYGGFLQTGAMAVDWVALIFMGLFLLHKVLHPEVRYRKMRNFFIFTSLFILSLGNCILFLIRRRAAVLCEGRPGMPNPCVIDEALIVISSCATFFAFVGFVVTYYEKSGPTTVTKSMISDPVSSASLPSHTHSMELGHVQTKYTRGDYPPWDPLSTRATRKGLVPSR